MTATGWLHDGRVAIRREVTVAADGDALLVRGQEGDAERIDPAQLTYRGDARGADQYGRTDAEGWRLFLPRPVDPSVARLLPRPERYGRWIDRVGLGPAIGGALVASAAVLALGYTLPGWLAPLIPQSWERAYGDALVGDFGGKACAGRDGQAALDRMAARLAPGADVRVRVVDLGMVNAAALPGGQIVVFRKLIDEASGPDELAGVLAHEIGHVEERHVTKAMVREMGVGLVVAMLGGTTGGNVDQVLSLNYGRGAESEADAYAINAMAQASISPRGAAAFFERLAGDERRLGRVGEAFGYLSTHPLSGARRARFAGSWNARTAYTPAASAADWAALRTICKAPKPAA